MFFFINKRDSKHCVKHIKYNFFFLRESLIISKNLILVPIERFSVV